MTSPSPGQRLALAITDSGRSKRQVAISIGISPQSITNAIARDAVSAKLAQSVAEQTGHRWEWIYSGEGPPCDREELSHAVRPVSQAVRRVPVISLGHAATWPRRIREAGEMGEIAIDSELAATLGPAAFCMAIEDDAMRDNSPESVQRGDKVVIDPDVEPQPGDLVVATAAALNGAIFRKYRARGVDAEGRKLVELVPLNADYAPTVVALGPDARIVGVMVEHRRTRRRIAS